MQGPVDQGRNLRQDDRALGVGNLEAAQREGRGWGQEVKWVSNLHFVFCILRFVFPIFFFLFSILRFVFAFCILHFAFCILLFAFCILHFEFWILNFEFYILHFEGHGVNPSECQSGPSDLSQSPSYPLCSQNGLNFSHRGGDGAPSLLNFATISSILFRPPVNPTLAEAFVQSPVFQSFEEKCGKMRSQLKMSSVNNIIAELCYKERSSSIVTSRDYL